MRGENEKKKQNTFFFFNSNDLNPRPDLGQRHRRTRRNSSGSSFPLRNENSPESQSRDARRLNHAEKLYTGIAHLAGCRERSRRDESVVGSGSTQPAASFSPGDVFLLCSAVLAGHEMHAATECVMQFKRPRSAHTAIYHTIQNGAAKSRRNIN